jgi:hypothetical protein
MNAVGRMWTAPRQGLFVFAALVGCGHVSGLIDAAGMAAGPAEWIACGGRLAVRSTILAGQRRRGGKLLQQKSRIVRSARAATDFDKERGPRADTVEDFGNDPVFAVLAIDLGLVWDERQRI